MNKIFLIAVFVFFSQFSSYGQGFWINKDTVYQRAITSVGFHPVFDTLGYPFIMLGTGEVLSLYFDDLRGGFTDLLYTVVHCDSDWRPSQLGKLEYINGFEEERLRDFRFSIATFDDYTHYKLIFPNQNMDVRVSGNYLLHIYQDDNEKTPLLTRRFVVTENLFSLTRVPKQATDVRKLRTHQEFDLRVSFKDVRVVNPMNEIRATFLQNGRWDNAIYTMAPQSVRGEEVIYDYLDKIIFPAGKEFRNFDIRSVLYRTARVREIVTFEDGVDVYLHADQSRANVKYITYPDANGRFALNNFDRFQEPETMSEYVLVHFTLDSPELFGKDVYVCGGLTDWKLDSRFKMTYDHIVKAYTGSAMLKQGFYDYIYVTSADGYRFDHADLEGNWSETENNYDIIVYFRLFGERYDRVAGWKRFNTLRD